jgi:hypothetical protein
VKYILLIHVNPAALEALTDRERDELLRGHDAFHEATSESGELVDAVALADPTNTVTVRVRDGLQTATDGPYVESKEHLAGWYLVDCESRERAVELAASIPDARLSALEVRPVMTQGGTEM